MFLFILVCGPGGLQIANSGDDLPLEFSSLTQTFYGVFFGIS